MSLNYHNTKKPGLLKPLIDRDGYLIVCLSKNDHKTMKRVHRLVAEAFIPNPNNKPQINHLDENKSNNFVDNLEWATAKENINYGTRTEKSVKTLSKSVYCVELDQTFESAAEANRVLGISKLGILACCNGKQKKSGKYHWQFKENKNG